MIQVKIGELLNSVDVLRELGKREMKAKLAWQIGKILTIADTEIQEYNQARIDLIKKYGQKDEEGNLIENKDGNCEIEDEHLQDFATELNELIGATIEMNANKINLDDLDNLGFTPTDMALLRPFIQE